MPRLNENQLLDPQLFDALQSLKLDIFRSMHCVKVGEVQSFDPMKKTVQAQILFKRVLPDGTLADYPVLVDCPVFTLQGGGGAIQFPIVAGDQCLLLFSDRNLDAWFQNGTSSAPFDARCHDLSDGICLVGLNPLPSSLSSYEASIARMFYDGAAVSMAGGIITLQNNTTTLLTLLNAFITVLEALTVNTSPSPTPLTAASIAALDAIKLQFASLLG